MSNPFLAPSTLPYQLPPFGLVQDDHYLPAFEAGFAEHLAEIESIVSSPEPASFENTVVALERAGSTLRRVALTFYNSSSAHSTPAIQALETEIFPRYAEHEDNISLNRGLFDRIKAVPTDGLDAESTRLVEEYIKRFIRAGAQLDDDAQGKLRALNTELSQLSTDFQQRLLRDTNNSALLVDTAEELAGLSADDIGSAAAAAESAGHPGKFLLTLILPTAQPAMETLTNRATRQRLHEASVNRGFADNENRTLGIAARMAELRANRAALLGFDSHAAAATDDQTAPSLDAIHQMLGQLAPAAVRNARAEAVDLEAAAGHPIEAWDWAYYSEKVRADKFDVDLSALRPYFELERVLQDGIFFAANKLYGLTFSERSDLEGYHPEVRVWEVRDADGGELGLFLGDYYTRDTKNGGAWMNSFVEQSTLTGTHAVVVNNLNIPKPPAGEPTLLTFDQVVTTFHEFGHALHGLFSSVTYPTFSGTSVPRDFVEYPSQVNEMWILWPEVVANYAKHYQTGEPLPAGTVEKLLAAQTWGEGFATTEYLGAALLDLAWHAIPAGTTVEDPVEFEREALTKAGLDFSPVPPRYRTGYFKHIFAGGYSAAYYAYIWSEVLDADTVEWFKSSGGLTRENGDHFRTELLSRGNSIDPLQAFRNFRGRDALIDPLLTRRGLA
ncbi:MULTISPECIES: M3 family metallopeptidase [unclassified Arthrobacter]|uniref:M3 family metallopeptidase n=1 Tax=unclassified Arthrobacter TaxID=235627 RepID=UPI0014920B32|nr:MULTISPECIES: M3 family metallopeptidase [unclassified Arthrobacter]MBE0011455.1 M3 family peptidase [Arthrobacter sp. AET 35A]NOJ64431.1 M3 family metallopeptidase [Arthrobacter sp. 147(2020)]